METLTADNIATAQNAPAEATEEAKPAFCINSDEAANWFLKKRNDKAAEIARIEAQAAAMIADLQRDIESLDHLYLGQMEEYARQKLAAAGGRKKTFRFFQGTVSFRTFGAAPRLDDPAAALTKAAELGHVKIDTENYLKAGRAALKESGELLPGLVMRPEREKFTIGAEASGQSLSEG